MSKGAWAAMMMAAWITASAPEADGQDAGDGAFVAVPRLTVAAPPLFVQVPRLLDETDPVCEDVSARVLELERSILEVKARYWAGRLKEGSVSIHHLILKL